MTVTTIRVNREISVASKKWKKAVENNHLEKFSNGCYWDKETNEEYWPDGTKKQFLF